MSTPNLDNFEQEIISQFEIKTGLVDVATETINRSDGVHLIFYVYGPSERFYSTLNRISEELPDDNPYKEHLVLKKKKDAFILKSPEVGCLQKTLSESLTVGKDSFRDEFFSRYIDSGVGAESKIQTPANHIVFGRRGAGKSSLLVYAMRILEKENNPFAWIDMQLFEKRNDPGVILEVLLEIISQVGKSSNEKRIIEKKINEILENKNNGGFKFEVQRLRMNFY